MPRRQRTASGAVVHTAMRVRPGLAVIGWILGAIAASVFLAPVAVDGAELEHCRGVFLSGHYAECIREAADAIRDRAWGEDWPVLQARAELAIGEYAGARATVGEALKRYSSSVRLRLVGREACLYTGDEAGARALLEEIDQLATRSPWRYSDAADLVALGEASLVFGADARDVLDGFFDRARRLEPETAEPWLACGRLALSKGDDELAAGYFQEALKHAAGHPDAHYGLARATPIQMPRGRRPSCRLRCRPIHGTCPACSCRSNSRSTRKISTPQARACRPCSRLTPVSRKPGHTAPCWPICRTIPVARQRPATRRWVAGRPTLASIT